MPKITIRQTVEAKDFSQEIELVTEGDYRDGAFSVVGLHLAAIEAWKEEVAEQQRAEKEELDRIASEGEWVLADVFGQVVSKAGSHDRVVLADREERTVFWRFGSREDADSIAAWIGRVLAVDEGVLRPTRLDDLDVLKPKADA